MENDPDEKESKGKRIIKKAKRRSSKSSNNSQNSALDPSVGVSRSKSFENKHLAVEINDSTPLPKPDGTKERHDHGANECKRKSDDKSRMHSGTAVTNKDRVKMKKIVDIQESHNEVFEKVASPSPKNVQPRKLDSDDEPFQKPESTKRILKRKLEEESGAGTSGASTTSDNDADDKDPKDKKKKNRCAVCRKKVGLTGFECRCGGLFCAVHRYSDKHECSFDYRELGAQEIRRNNPVVVSQKIHKI